MPDRTVQDARVEARPERGPLVYRVQDSQGRGPFKPGMSHRWLDDNDKPLPPSIFEDFPGVIESMDASYANGCALETLDQVRLWFSPSEMRRMNMLGYRLVRMSVDRVLAASIHQLVVSRREPFRKGATPVPWPLSDGASTRQDGTDERPTI